jgi:hypothetical protein
VAEEHGIMSLVEAEAECYPAKRGLESVQAVGCVSCKGTGDKANEGKGSGSRNETQWKK